MTDEQTLSNLITICDVPEQLPTAICRFVASYMTPSCPLANDAQDHLTDGNSTGEGTPQPFSRFFIPTLQFFGAATLHS